MNRHLIHTPHEFAAYIGAKTEGTLAEVEASCKAKVYRQTACGATVDFYRPDGGAVVALRLSSTVEGSEQVARHPPLYFPFSPDDYEDAVSYIEDEVDNIIDEEARL